MALGEAVVGEGGEFQPDLLADVVGDAIGPHPVEEPGLEIVHALAAALGTHCLTQHVGVGRGEVRDVDCDLHQLLLEERHAEGLGQRVLEQRMEVGDGFEAVSTADVGMH